jgi:hypothetical protein
MDIKRLSLKSIETIGTFFVFILGSFLHFTYELSGNNQFVALFSAVNESVWEHTKLLLLPILIFGIVEYYYRKDLHGVLTAKLFDLLTAIAFIIVLFYTYTGAFGIESLVIDIALFFGAAALGKYVSFIILTSRKPLNFSALAAGLAILFLIAFYIAATFNPPRIPLFEDKTTQTYGTG